VKSKLPPTSESDFPTSTPRDPSVLPKFSYPSSNDDDSMLLLEGPPSSQFLQVLSGQADKVNAGANGIKLYFLVLRTEINGPCRFIFVFCRFIN
jgi:hypothetical protein